MAPNLNFMLATALRLTHSNILRKAACATPVLLATLQAQTQQPITLKSGTVITLRIQQAIDPAKVKIGDAVDLALLYPIRSGNLLLAPARTPIHGRVTALPPNFAVELDPMDQPNTAPLPLPGNPFALVKGKPQPIKLPARPPELAWHNHIGPTETAELTALGVVAAPILVLASPFLLYGALHHDKQPLLYNEGHIVQLHLASDVTVDPTAFSSLQTIYQGLPILYLVDRYSEKGSAISCGTDLLLGERGRDTNLLRILPGTYPFHTNRPSDAAATLDAQSNHRYLIYRDSAGLHQIDLDATPGRPDLLDLLPPLNDKTKWFFDTTTLLPSQQATMDDLRARGGCGIAKVLHTRPPTSTNP